MISDLRVPVDRTHRAFWTGLAVVIVLAVVSIYLFEQWGQDPHGQPDPGGRRDAAITTIAPTMLVAGVTGVQVEHHGFKWDPATCDGQAPGWANADVDMTFHASSDLPASLDALMRRLNWAQPQPDRSATGPAPAQPPPDFRVYEPTGRNPYAETASLTPPATYGDGLWDLEVSASPAEVPAHDC